MDDALQPTDEMNAAELVRDGVLPSGTKYENIHLFAMRIFGTGAAYRVGLDEYTWRDPAIFLAPEMVQRCNGLPVIIDHPENALLNSEEFSNRVVGSVMLPYIKGDEVWGVARIYDDAVASVMRETQLSTSPTVSFSNSHDNTTINLDDGSKLLIEGNPSLLCHVAICERGVWDKGGAPAGIDTGSVSVTDEEKAKADAERDEKEKADKAKADAEAGKVEETEDLHSKMDKILDLIGGLSTRMDSVEKRKDSEDGETEEKRKEREAKEKADAECKERDDKAKADAESLKARMDAFDEKTKPRSDEDMDAMADAQCKADSAYSSHGQRAPRPMAGETPLAFRLRALRGLQQHSPSLKGANLALIAGDAVAFADIEGRIYADSEAASRRPAAIPEGVLMKRERQEGPHTITEFLGRSPSVWMNEFRRVNTRGSIKQIKAA